MADSEFEFRLDCSRILLKGSHFRRQIGRKGKLPFCSKQFQAECWLGSFFVRIGNCQNQDVSLRRSDQGSRFDIDGCPLLHLGEKDGRFSHSRRIDQVEELWTSQFSSSPSKSEFCAVRTANIATQLPNGVVLAVLWHSHAGLGMPALRKGVLPANFFNACYLRCSYCKELQNTAVYCNF